MKYYPKSQIKTNLYTGGNEFVLFSTKEDYKGYYWGTSTGEFFTGKTPSDTPTLKLIAKTPIDINTLKTIDKTQQNTLPTNPSSYYVVNESYFISKKIPLTKNAPTYPTQYVPYLTQKEYDEGGFIRYFLKKNNEFKYIEISPDEYTLYTSRSSLVPYEAYTPISIVWYLTPSIASTNNLATVSKVEREYGFYGFAQYFNNKFDQFVMY